MPVSGPRNQTGAVPGYRNPGMEEPTRFQMWLRPDPVAQPGRSPGLSVISLRGCVLAAGQVRRMWRQSVNYTPASAAYSWTSSAPAPGMPVVAPPPFMVTRALRYMTRSTYMGAGIDNSRFEGLHTAISPRAQRSPQARGRRVTIAAGSVRSRPTVRNRMTSFGSRVPVINQPVTGAEQS